jgi:hypothetical protein
MALKSKIFLSGEWIFLCIRKTLINPMKFDFQLTLVDDGPGSEARSGSQCECFFHNVDGLEVDDLRLAGHLSLEIKRSADLWPEEMRFEVTDLESDSLHFRCTAIKINGEEF